MNLEQVSDIKLRIKRLYLTNNCEVIAFKLETKKDEERRFVYWAKNIYMPNNASAVQL